MNSEISIYSSNHLSGKHSVGPRFQFRVRSIARRNLYLPLRMRELPEIRQLIEGISPLAVFSCASILDARQAFCDLRKKFDFSYWCALDYKVPDLESPDRMVPLWLNLYQVRAINEVLRKTRMETRSFFIIAKSVPRCGLTTCLRAYIEWLRSYHLNAGCVVCSSISDSLSIPPDNAFVLLADVAKWPDRIGDLTHRIYSLTLNSIPRCPHALFLMEGDKPNSRNFRPELYRDMSVPEPIRLMNLSRFSSNPFFLDRMLAFSSERNALIQFIDLDFP